MPTIAILEGAYSPYQDEMLGKIKWKKAIRRVRKVTKKVSRPVVRVTKKVIRPVNRVVKKVTRPIAKVVRPVYKPLDKILKKTPIVRTAYRASIATTYAATGQFSKVPKAYVRTGKSAVKDFAGAKKLIQAFSDKTVGNIVKSQGSNISKTTMKVLAIPSVTAFAASSIGPWAIPYVGVAVNTSVNVAYAALKRNVKKIPALTQRAVSRNLARFTKTIPSSPYTAQKMSEIPSSNNTPVNPFEQNQSPEPAKSGFNPLLLALPALALLM